MVHKNTRMANHKSQPGHYYPLHSGKDGRSEEVLPGAQPKFRGARGATTKNVHPGCTIIFFRGAISSNPILGVHARKEIYESQGM